MDAKESAVFVDLIDKIAVVYITDDFQEYLLNARKSQYSEFWMMMIHLEEFLN